MLWFDFTMSVSCYVSTFTWQLLKKKVCLQMFGCLENDTLDAV